MTIRQLQIIAVSLFLTAMLTLFWAWTIVSQPLSEFGTQSLDTPSANKNKEAAQIILSNSQVLDQAIQRPIFEQARIPFVPKPPAVVSVVAEPIVITAPTPVPTPEPQPPPPPLQFELSLKGIFTSQTKDQALIISPEQPNGKWYAAGEVVGGWKISRIFKAGVKFEAAGETRELKLYVDNPGNPLAPPQQPL